jgi:hypothetical protein
MPPPTQQQLFDAVLNLTSTVQSSNASLEAKFAAQQELILNSQGSAPEIKSEGIKAHVVRARSSQAGFRNVKMKAAAAQDALDRNDADAVRAGLEDIATAATQGEFRSTVAIEGFVLADSRGANRAGYELVDQLGAAFEAKVASNIAAGVVTNESHLKEVVAVFKAGDDVKKARASRQPKDEDAAYRGGRRQPAQRAKRTFPRGGDPYREREGRYGERDRDYRDDDRNDGYNSRRGNKRKDYQRR